jgi:hypothetical protein
MKKREAGYFLFLESSKCVRTKEKGDENEKVYRQQ